MSSDRSERVGFVPEPVGQERIHNIWLARRRSVGQPRPAPLGVEAAAAEDDHTLPQALHTRRTASITFEAGRERQPLAFRRGSANRDTLWT